MAPPRMPEGHPWAFHPDARCCTYHPKLPNYLVGRALTRGGAGAERVRQRLSSAPGISAWGIAEPADWQQGAMAGFFGRDVSLQCPYWTGGELSCGIWADRTGVCRSWFCKHEHGELSRARWRTYGDVMSEIEDGIATQLAASDHAPDPASADPSTWEAWFRDCARRADALSSRELAAVRGPLADDLIARCQSLVGEAPRPMPKAPVAIVSHGFSVGDVVAVEGYTPYDGVEGPAELLDFFAQLDGERSWQQALCAAGIDGDNGRELVAELHRIGVLLEPHAGGGSRAPVLPIPEHLEPSVQRPIVIGDRVWLRGASSAVSIVAPRAVFELLAQLDGSRPWRELPGVDEGLVRALYERGALVATS